MFLHCIPIHSSLLVVSTPHGIQIDFLPKGHQPSQLRGKKFSTGELEILVVLFTTLGNYYLHVWTKLWKVSCQVQRAS